MATVECELIRGVIYSVCLKYLDMAINLLIASIWSATKEDMLWKCVHYLSDILNIASII